MPFSCPPHVLHGGTSEISSGRYPLYFTHQLVSHCQWLLQRKADCPLPPTEEQDYPLPGVGRGRSESPEGSASSLVPARQTQVGQSTALSSSHPPSPNPPLLPLGKDTFLNRADEAESKAENLLQDVSSSQSPPSHQFSKSWSWQNLER